MPESTNSSALPEARLWVTILAGGSGTRFWPASTPRRPKQLLPLGGDRPLIQDTMERARRVAPLNRIRILAGEHLRATFQETLGELDESVFLLEPQARGTGPVLVWAAWEIARQDPDAILLSLHSDHAIQPLATFEELVRRGAALAAETEALFTVAVPPTRPETGYGYIQPGRHLPGASGVEAFLVKSFIEKPDRDRARQYLEAGYLWNSGIFLWKAALFLEEVASVAPELGKLLPLLEGGEVEEFFRRAPTISVDEAVLERSRKVASLRADFQWDDVGSWEALGRTRTPDSQGNVRVGKVEVVQSRDNIVMAEDGTVVLFGVEGLAVVRSGEIVLVANREKTPELKTLLDQLPPHLRDPD